MQRPRRMVAGALAASIGLAAAACGGDDASSDATSASGAEAGATTTPASETTAAPATTGAPATTAGGGAGSTAEQPASLEEWEELWAAERAAIVERIEENGWGVSADGTTLTGPSGFTVDLSACAGGTWNNTEGLTDTEIKFGHTISLSGTTADYGNATKTAKLIFDYYSERGAFEDSEGKTRKINYIVKDDGYDSARTIPLVDELLDSERTFAHWGLGTPNILKTYDKLNQRCVPNVFMQSGHPAFGDPVNHPWTVGAPQTSYSTESVLWGAFIEQRLDEFPDGKVKVAALVMNNDFGRIYDASFKAYLESSEHKDRIEYVTETIEPQAPTISDPMTTLAAEQPQVFIAMVAAQQCTQAIVAAAENGMKESVDYLMQPAVCTGTGYVNKEKVGGDGMAADGWWLMNPAFKDFNDPSQFEDPWIAWGRKMMLDAGLDPKLSSSFGTGLLYGWPLVQVLQIAGDLEGGLTRANMILATRALDMTHPGYLPGVKMRLDGNADGYAEEAGVFQQWDAANQIWVVKGNVIDLDGKSTPCAWDAGAGICR